MELSTTQQLNKFFRRWSPVLLGAIAGYAYYAFIGCVYGSCPITSNPWSSTAYGALMGLIFTIGKPKTKNEEQK